jgi:hypothetical protein
MPVSPTNTYNPNGLQALGLALEMPVRLLASTVFGAGGKPCGIAESAAGSGIWQPSASPTMWLKYAGATDANGNFFPGATATPPTQSVMQAGDPTTIAYARGVFYTAGMAQSGTGAISTTAITALGGKTISGDTTYLGGNATQPNGCLIKF